MHLSSGDFLYERGAFIPWRSYARILHIAQGSDDSRYPCHLSSTVVSGDSAFRERLTSSLRVFGPWKGIFPRAIVVGSCVPDVSIALYSVGSCNICTREPNELPVATRVSGAAGAGAAGAAGAGMSARPISASATHDLESNSHHCEIALLLLLTKQCADRPLIAL